MILVFSDFLAASGTFENVITRISVAYSYLRFEIPMFSKYPIVSVSDAAAHEPSLIPMVRKVSEVSSKEIDAVV
jgi:hypothetical protein